MSRWSGRLITRNPVTPGGSAPNASAPGMWTLPEMAYWKQQGLWPDASADAYWGYISYLMATSSLSNANNNLFVDSSSVFNPVARVGNTNQGSVTPYGTLWSNYFDGSSYITMASGTAAGTGDFTIEGWFNLSSFSTGPELYDARPTSTNGAYPALAVDTSGYLVYYVNGATQIQGATAAALNTWNHFALCRSGTSTRLFLNGVQQGSTYSDSNNYLMGSSRPIIGGNGFAPGSASQLTGYVSNIRVVNGTALYTAAFTPPAAALTAISGTVLLTCQSNRFRDASSYNVSVSVSGSPQVSPFSPFVLNAPGISYNQNDISYWSGYFDGTGDYLTVPSDAAFGYGTGDFTIEFWMYLTGTSDQTIISNLTSASSTNPHIYYSGGTIRYYTASADRITSGSIVVGQWYHVALTRASGSTKMFVNGVQAGSTYADSNNYGSTAPLGIATYWSGGSPVATSTFIGYMSNARIVKGTAVYTSNFTPPTAPLTAISGTSVLTCQSAAFTDNSTNNFAITQYGNTTVTGNNPYQSGYYSNYFDGGSSLTSATATAPGTGDFTVEGWFNMPSIGSTRIMYDARPSGTNGAYQTIYVDLNGYLSLYANSADQIKSTNVVSLNVWNHFALCRSGTSTRLFLNGVQQGSTYTDTNNWLIGASRPAIGTDGVNLAGNFFTGYLSNIRSVNGTALYTSAFTPPTAPLTAISGTSLLTCQSGRFIDSSTNNLAITRNGNVSVQSFDPFYTATVASNGGSGYFDGSGDYITAPNSPAFNLGNGNFTLECWVYNSEVTNNCGYAGVWGGGYILYREATTYRFYYAGPSGSPLTSSIAAIKGAWTHLAVVRNGTTLTFYVNGVSGGSTSVGTTAISFPAFPFTAGANYDSGAVGYPFTGYMAGLRLVKGTAVYTSAFTPPTTPPTPISGTSFLCNFTNAGTYDAAMQNNLETVGNARVASAQAKYGTTSAYIPDATSLLKGPLTQNTAFGTGNFTVEAWIYSVATTGGYTCIFTSRDGIASNANAVFFGLKPTTNQLTFFTSGEIIGTTTAVSTGVWTHVALVRNAGATAIYINGTSAGTATFTTALTGTGLAIGNEYSLASSNGGLYVDDLRITKGYARYTANFTPPTAALPVY